MIRVRAPARLHMGLLSLPGEGEDAWLDHLGQPALPARMFGGVGLMVESPHLELTIQSADSWSAEGPLADRALTFAHRFAATFSSGEIRPRHLAIEQAPPAHAGLGSGTQLALAVAHALAQAAGHEDLSVVDLARRVGRGERSALGVHGFARGGFLVEGGKRRAGDIAPLLARWDFPSDWRILLCLPTAGERWHGERERNAFTRLRHSVRPSGTDSLCRLVLLGMLPALVEKDLETFGAALYDFNARVGEAFRDVQGGLYATPHVAEVVGYLRGLGIRGVGQSSWGPTVFAVLGDEDQARAAGARVEQRFGPGTRVLVTRAYNRGVEKD